MRFSMRFTLAALLAATLLTFPLAWAKKPGGGGGGGGPAYTIIPFRPPGFESVSSRILGLNDTGDAVGVAVRTNGDGQAVHLDIATGAYTSLKSGSGAYGVNDHNQIVGGVDVGDLQFGAFWSSPSADPILLPPLTGDMESVAVDINNDGIVVGTSLDENGQGVGVVWRVVIDGTGDPQVDGPLALAPLAGETSSWITEVNEIASGVAQVAGSSRNFGDYNFDVDEAVIWTVSLNPDGSLAVPGAPRGLGTFGLRDPSQSNAGAVNNAGVACGTSDWWPFIAPAGQGVQPLDVPRKSVGGTADDVNDLGEAVGMLEIWSEAFQLGVRHAYLWKNGKVIDLEKQIDRNSGWNWLSWANQINNAGVITGWGSFDVPGRGFLMIRNP